MRSAIRLVISVFVIIAVVIVAFSYGEAQREIACSEDSYMEVVGALLDEWEDAVELARSAKSDVLPARISALRDIHLKASDISVPRCGTDAQAILISHMEITIDAFDASLGEKDEKAKELFNEASDAKHRWQGVVEDLGE